MGFIGADVFFVISGDLISGNIFSGIRSGHFNLGDFYVQRARRILPALAVMLAGTAGNRMEHFTPVSVSNAWIACLCRGLAADAGN